MNEAVPGAVLGTAGLTGRESAGTMIRAARRAQGVQIEALAAAIKVSQHKLELLEADRLDELPDATFVRALAQTVCRSLKIDPRPVLAELPLSAGHRLDQISEGINAPFRDRPGRREPGDWSVLARPAVWGPALLVLAAFALYVAPAGWLSAWTRLPKLPLGGAADAARPATAPPLAASAAAVADAAASAAETAAVLDSMRATLPAPEQVAARAASAVALPAPASAAALAATADGSSTLQLRANAESWVEVVDARSRVLLSRMLQPGETVALDGALPLKLKVGNAAGTEAVFRGQALDLLSTTRDNVARLELK